MYVLKDPIINRQGQVLAQKKNSPLAGQGALYTRVSHFMCNERSHHKPGRSGSGASKTRLLLDRVHCTLG